METKLPSKYQVICLYKNGELYESIEHQSYERAKEEAVLLREHNIDVNDGIKKLAIIPMDYKGNQSFPYERV